MLGNVLFPTLTLFPPFPVLFCVVWLLIGLFINIRTAALKGIVSCKHTLPPEPPGREQLKPGAGQIALSNGESRPTPVIWTTVSAMLSPPVPQYSSDKMGHCRTLISIIRNFNDLLQRVVEGDC